MTRDVNQEALDHAQQGRDNQQEALDESAVINLPTSEQPDAADSSAIRRAIERAGAARERAETALIRAQAAMVRAEASETRAQKTPAPS